MNHLGGAILPPAPVQHSSRTAKAPKAFTVAAYTTACRCLICHANYVLPARPVINVRTRYGATSICDNHRLNHCVVCLIAGEIDSFKFPYLVDSSADVGQQSYGLNHITCRDCRIQRFEAFVQMEFVGVGGAGSALGYVKPRDESAVNYFFRGLGTAHAAARHAVALEWIRPHVPIDRIIHAAWCLDTLESQLKDAFYEDRAYEDKDQRERRKRLEAVVWDRPFDMYDDGEDEDDRALERLYQDWEDFLDDRDVKRMEGADDWDLEDGIDELMVELKEQTRVSDWHVPAADGSPWLDSFLLASATTSTPGCVLAGGYIPGMRSAKFSGSSRTLKHRHRHPSRLSLRFSQWTPWLLLQTKTKTSLLNSILSPQNIVSPPTRLLQIFYPPVTSLTSSSESTTDGASITSIFP